jgi:hypothetical protein
MSHCYLTRHFRYAACVSHYCFSVSANFMDLCPNLCTVPVMHGTRADITFKNDIYGFGGNALSSVAQNNLWTLRSDGSWHSIIPGSPQSHVRTSWPQMVPKMHPVSGKWDGDTLISVSSNDDAYHELHSAGFMTITLFSATRRVWSSPPQSAVSCIHRAALHFINSDSYSPHRRSSILLQLVVATC